MKETTYEARTISAHREFRLARDEACWALLKFALKREPTVIEVLRSQVAIAYENALSRVPTVVVTLWDTPETERITLSEDRAAEGMD